MKIFTVAYISFILATRLVGAQSEATPPLRPIGGVVPDAESAIAIAVAVWSPKYGKEEIEKQKPYHARLSNGVWTVAGSLPPNMVGGVALIEISQEDARILRVEHGR